MATDVSLNSIEIQIEAAATGAADKINTLADRIHDLATGGNDTSRLNDLANAIRDVGRAAGTSVSSVSNFSRVLQTVNTTQGVERRLSTLANSIRQIGSEASTGGPGFSEFVQNLREVASINAMANLTGLRDGLHDLIDTFSNATQALNDYRDALESAQNQAGNGMPRLPRSEGSARGYNEQADALIRIGMAARTALSWIGKLISTTAKFTVGAAFKHAAGEVGGFVKKLTEGFAALKRIAVYRLLRTAIKEITKAFKEGLENAYFYSKEIGSDLAPALDMLAVKSQTMRNQMGAAFGSLLQIVMPIIQQLISWITALASAITSLFAMFGGKGTYMKAVDASAQFAKNTKAGAGAAKQMKDYLMGIDELNVIKEPADSGGGGGGANALDYASMFMMDELPDWMKKIQDLINADEFYKAGQALADHLNELIPSPEQFRAWGEKFGGHIQNALEFALGYYERIDWQVIGEGLSNFLMGVIGTVSATKLGEFMVQKINAAINEVRGFLRGFDAVATGKWLATFVMNAINEIDWELAGETIREGIKTALDIVTTFIETISFQPFFTKLGQFFSELLGATEEPKQNIVTAFSELGAAIDNILDGFQTIAEKFAESFFSAPPGEKSTYQTILTDLSEAFETVARQIKQFSEDFENWAKTSPNLDKLIEDINTLATAFSGIVNSMTQLLANFNIDFPSALESVTGVLSGISEATAIAVALIGELTEDINILVLRWKGLTNQLTFDEMMKSIAESAERRDRYRGVLEDTGKDLGTWLINGYINLSPGNKIATSVINTIVDKVKGGKGKAVEAVGELGGAMQTEVDKAMQAIGFEITGMSTSYEDLFGKLKTDTEDTSKIFQEAYSAYEEANAKAQANSEELHKLSTETEEDIKKGIEQAILDAGKSFTEGIQEIETQLGQVVTDIVEGTGKMLTAMTAQVGAFYVTIASQFGALVTQAIIGSGNVRDAVLLDVSTMHSNLESTLALSQSQLILFFTNAATLTLNYTNYLTDCLNTAYTNLETTINTRVSPLLTKLYNNLMDGINAIYDHLEFQMNATVENLDIHCTDAKDIMYALIDDVRKYHGDNAEEVMDYVLDNITYVDTELKEMTNTFKANMMDAAGTARQEIRAIREAMKELDGYTVHVYIKVHTIGGDVNVSSGGTNLSSSNGIKKANGGLIRLSHGGIIRAANGASNLNQGQFFIAREAGPELVGSVGNNSTAILNNNQIVESVSDGVRAAMLDVMATQTSSEGQQVFVLNVDSREIARAVRQGNKSSGYQLASNPTFA